MIYRILCLARRDYAATVRTKGFIIGLVLLPLIMGGGAVGSALWQNRADTDEIRLAVVDRSASVADALVAAALERNRSDTRDANGRQVRPDYSVEIVAADGQDPLALRVALSDRVRRGELHGFVEVGAAVVHPDRDPERAGVSYYARNAALDDARRWLATALNTRVRNLRLEEAGVSPALVEAATTWVTVAGMGLASQDQKTGQVADAEHSSEAAAVGVPMAVLFIMFMMQMVGTTPLMTAVMEEKTQRIAEVVLGSVTPFELMMGKLAGGAAVSLTTCLTYVVVAAVVALQTGLAAMFPWGLLPWFITYLVLAVFMVGALMVALGAACDEPRDTQALALPAMLPLMIPLFAMVPVLEQPGGSLATWMSLVPLWTPTLMVARLASPVGVPLWQPVVGLVGMAATTVLAVWVGGRIFRVGILMQGQAPRLSTLARWALRG